MKFLFFSNELPLVLKNDNKNTGGAAVQWYSWMNGFIATGHTFGILTWKGAKKYIDKLNTDYDIVESYNLYKGIKSIRLIYYRLPMLFLAIKNYQPDYLIQASATLQTGILMIIAKLLRIKFVHRVAHDAHTDHRINLMLKNKRTILFYRIGLKYSDYIIAQNNYQYRNLKNIYPKKKISVLHNPYHIEKNKYELLKRNERNYVAWIGSFKYMKNLPALYDVAKELPNINFKIAGKIHESLDLNGKNALSQIKTLKNVILVGFLRRSEVLPFLSKSILLLNTSHFEGFSNTFLEAWSCGTPVVTTNNANPDGLIEKYKLGRVASDFSNLAGFIEEINKLEVETYEALSTRCYNYVKENHDPLKLAKKFVDFLNKN